MAGTLNQARHRKVVTIEKLMGYETAKAVDRPLIHAAIASLFRVLGKDGAVDVVMCLGEQAMTPDEIRKRVKDTETPIPLDSLVKNGLVSTCPEGKIYTLTKRGRAAWTAVRGLCQ